MTFAYSANSSGKVTAEFLKQNPRFQMPHIVILGAGASRQAFPSGDRQGLRLPIMNELVECVGLSEKLMALGALESEHNFETIYSHLYANPEKRTQLAKIEEQIHDYFSQMHLPEQPTLYDHLLLSLRRTDLVATFNWDPLLFDSRERLSYRYDSNFLPPIAYLHGNVRVGYCREHKVYDRNGRQCPYCNQWLAPTPLLFPIEDKDYDKDVFIMDAWQMLRAGLEEAFTVTIFGYSAPSSDSAAVDAMLKAWKKSSEREFETISIIDLKTRNEISATWRPFFFSESPHYKTHIDFYKSLLPRSARRSVECLYVPTVEGKFVAELPIPRDGTWNQLDDWFWELVAFEKRMA